MLRWFIAPFFSLIIFILRNCDNKKKELYYRSTSKISLCTYATDSTFLRMIWNRLLSFTKSTFRRFSLYRPLNLTVAFCYHWFYCVKKFWRFNQLKLGLREGHSGSFGWKMLENRQVIYWTQKFMVVETLIWCAFKQNNFVGSIACSNFKRKN